MQTLVSNIQRFSVHDGPGIRTTVFFMGCPLKCKWCHNPEAIERSIRLMYNNEVCIGCGSCVPICPHRALEVTNEKNRIDRQRCDNCMKCVKACPTLALQTSGRRYELNELVKEVMKDEVVFRNGGGVTLSGGEPLFYIDFLEPFLKKLREKAVHIAVETSGSVSWKNYERVLHLIDLFLIDVKMISPDKHKTWVGTDNKNILENIRRISRAGRPLTLRIPLIPRVNDHLDEFRKIVSFAKSLDQINSIHILPFHQIGQDKYSQLNMNYELGQMKEDNPEQVEACAELVRRAGFKVSIGGAGVREDIR